MNRQYIRNAENCAEAAICDLEKAMYLEPGDEYDKLVNAAAYNLEQAALRLRDAVRG